MNCWSRDLVFNPHNIVLIEIPGATRGACRPTYTYWLKSIVRIKFNPYTFDLTSNQEERLTKTSHGKRNQDDLEKGDAYTHAKGLRTGRIGKETSGWTSSRQVVQVPKSTIRRGQSMTDSHPR